MPERRIPRMDILERKIAGEENDQEESKKEEVPKTEAEKMQDLAESRFHDYFDRHKRKIEVYIGTSKIPFKMEDPGWYVNLEPKNIYINADPSFFLEKGYTEEESLFATYHEAEHFRDMLENPDLYQRLFNRIKKQTKIHKAYPQALNRLYNCVDDIVVNKAVMRRSKANNHGIKAKNSLYPKLFPTNDFSEQPKHRQLMYTLLREAMLPDEECIVSEDVREEINEMHRRGFISAITKVNLQGKSVPVKLKDGSEIHRFSLMASVVEPVFAKFYKDDLENLQPPENDGKGKKGKKGEKGEGEPQQGDSQDGDPFGDDPFEDAIPDPMDFDEAADQINKAIKAKKEEEKKEFEETMGVDKRDFEQYRKDYEKVSKYIEDLSKVFDDVIQRRKEEVTVWGRQPVEEGPMLHPGHLATGIANARAGGEAKIMRKRVKKEKIREHPNRLEFTLVCDGSGSMSGEKAIMQRRLAILVTEAFAVFRQRLAREKRKGSNVELSIKSEVRMFSDKDQVVKPLSEDFDHKQRIAMRKKLIDMPFSTNNEPATFEAIKGEQFDKETVKGLRSGDLKKMIIFLTDGESDSAKIQKHIVDLNQYGIEDKTGNQNLIIGGVGFAEGRSAQQTYAPNGHYAKNFDEIPDIFKDLIQQILSDF